MTKTYTGVTKFTSRHGKIKWRFRMKGKPKCFIPGPYGSDEFVAAWEQCMAGTYQAQHANTMDELPVTVAPVIPAIVPAAAGALPPSGSMTVNRLVEDYYASSNYKGLGDLTRKVYKRVLEKDLVVKNGEKSAAIITHENIVKKMDSMAHLPGSANQYLKVMKSLCGWATYARVFKVDPTREVKKIKYQKKGFHRWLETESVTFEEAYPMGTRARLAYELFATTGQRLQAVPNLGPANLSEDGNVLTLTQKKTGVEVVLPVLPSLREAIAACPTAQGETFLRTERDEPFTIAGLGNWFRDRCHEAGLMKCSAHGVRKAVATRLAQRGATAHEIMAVTGHKTLAEAQRYTEEANRKRLAQGVADKIARVAK